MGFSLPSETIFYSIQRSFRQRGSPSSGGTVSGKRVIQDFGIFASFAGFVEKIPGGLYLVQCWFRNPKTSLAQMSDPK